MTNNEIAALNLRLRNTSLTDSYTILLEALQKERDTERREQEIRFLRTTQEQDYARTAALPGDGVRRT